jgi:predicted RNase H-like nuclease (RuvC/YqgF family)
VSINDDILYKIDSEIEKDKEVVKLKREIERLGNELQIQIEDNVRLNEYIEEKYKEIERLNNIINDYENTKNQLQQKENIIKEVREKIENTTINCDGQAEDLIDDVLEILDKAGSDKE